MFFSCGCFEGMLEGVFSCRTACVLTLSSVGDDVVFDISDDNIIAKPCSMSCIFRLPTSGGQL